MREDRFHAPLRLRLLGAALALCAPARAAAATSFVPLPPLEPAPTAPGALAAPDAHLLFVGSPVTNGGAVYLYGAEGPGFGLVRKIVPEAGQTYFGDSLAAEADVVAIGSAYRVDFFVRSGDVLSANGHADFDDEVLTLSTDGVRLIVGVPDAVSIWRAQPGGWVEEQRLDVGDGFGAAVAIEGDRALVGAPREPDASGLAVGAVHVLVRTEGTWTEQQVLRPSDPVDFANFGLALDLEGTRAVVGSYVTFHGVNEGSAYVFERSGETWSETARLSSVEPNTQSGFGSAVGLAGDVIVVGSSNSGASPPFSGALEVFLRSGSTWAPQQRLFGDVLDQRLGKRLFVRDQLLVAGGASPEVRAYVGVGRPCGAASECVSGACVDGFCCERACDRSCESCSLGGLEGLCRTVVAEHPPPGHPSCDAHCVDGEAFTAGTCDGEPECSGIATTPCAPFACGASACLSACSTSAECTPGYACDPASHSCTADHPVCDGEHTLTRPGGESVSCAPYRCTPDGACGDHCAQNDACASGALCDADGACVLPAEPADGCAASAHGAARAGATAALFAALAMLVGMRRARSRGSP